MNSIWTIPKKKTRINRTAWFATCVATKKVAILQSLWTKSTLETVSIEVWCSKPIQNALGGRCPDLALSPKNFPCLCTINIGVSINVVRWVFESGRYTCPPSYKNIEGVILCNGVDLLVCLLPTAETNPVLCLFHDGCSCNFPRGRIRNQEIRTNIITLCSLLETSYSIVNDFSRRNGRGARAS